MRKLVATNPSLTDLQQAANNSGLRSLRKDGLGKVAAGMTTVEEIMRVTEIQ